MQDYPDGRRKMPGCCPHSLKAAYKYFENMHSMRHAIVGTKLLLIRYLAYVVLLIQKDQTAKLWTRNSANGTTEKAASSWLRHLQVELDVDHLLEIMDQSADAPYSLETLQTYNIALKEEITKLTITTRDTEERNDKKFDRNKIYFLCENFDDRGLLWYLKNTSTLSEQELH